MMTQTILVKHLLDRVFPRIQSKVENDYPSLVSNRRSSTHSMSEKKVSQDSLVMNVELWSSQLNKSGIVAFHTTLHRFV